MIINDKKLQLELISRGVEKIIEEQELESKIERSISFQIPMIVKLGADPTAPDLHLGHTVVFRKLKHFQQLGHQAVFLIGDFTGRIGDPTGRDQTRPPLTEEQVLLNAKTYQRQISKILDINNLKIVFNSHWLKSMTFEDVVRLTSWTTMSKLLEHNTFRTRFEHEESIRFNEMLYPFMQAYDSVALKADVELGGTDQTFNLTFGREIQRVFSQSPQICITLPILPGTDGKQKMSKSLGNYIGVDEPPTIMFDKIMRMTDDNIISYYVLLTDIDMEKVNELQNRLNKSPDTQFIVDAKKNLAKEIVALYHSEKDAQLAYDGYGKTDKTGLPELSLKNISTQTLTEWMVISMGVASKSEARRLLEQGGVKINGNKILADMPVSDLSPNDILKIGKIKSFKIIN